VMLGWDREGDSGWYKCNQTQAQQPSPNVPMAGSHLGVPLLMVDY
jgi:hypothetical protein